MLLFSFPSVRWSLHPACPLQKSEQWVTAAYRLQPMRNLSVSPSSIIRNETMSSCQPMGHYCVPDPELWPLCEMPKQHFLLSHHTVSHDTKDAQILQRSSCKPCPVTFSKISPLCRSSWLILLWSELSLERQEARMFHYKAAAFIQSNL